MLLLIIIAKAMSQSVPFFQLYTHREQLELLFFHRGSEITAAFSTFAFYHRNSQQHGGMAIGLKRYVGRSVNARRCLVLSSLLV